MIGIPDYVQRALDADWLASEELEEARRQVKERFATRCEKTCQDAVAAVEEFYHLRFLLLLEAMEQEGTAWCSHYEPPNTPTPHTPHIISVEDHVVLWEQSCWWNEYGGGDNCHTTIRSCCQAAWEPRRIAQDWRDRGGIGYGSEARLARYVEGDLFEVNRRGVWMPAGIPHTIEGGPYRGLHFGQIPDELAQRYALPDLPEPIRQTYGGRIAHTPPKSEEYQTLRVNGSTIWSQL